MAIIGIDIGGSKSTVLVGTSDGRVLSRRQFPTDVIAPLDAFIATARAAAAAAIEEAAAEGVEPECVSVSVGGPLDEATGKLLSPPHLPAWWSEPLAAKLAAAFALPVYLMHDARAGAFAEFHFGAGREAGARSMVFLTFGTGFGCGVVHEGRLLAIPGEVGHWRVAEDGPALFGKAGSLEGYASGAGMLAWARQMGFPEGTTLEALAAEARGGSLEAQGVFSLAAREVGRQCARLVDLLNPDVIVLGSLAVRCGDLVMETIREEVAREAVEHLGEGARVVPAGLGEALGDTAALSAAIHGGYRENFAGPPARRQLDELAALVHSVACNRELLSQIDRIAALLVRTLASGGKVMTCGNGGSTADAAHLAEELVARYRGNRVALPAINLSGDAAVITCAANDFGWESVFSRQIEAFGQPGDLLFGFTTSGNSENINKAFEVARSKGVTTVAVTGKSGGRARGLADHAVIVPSENTARIQEVHGWLLHVWCEAVEAQFESS